MTTISSFDYETQALEYLTDIDEDTQLIVSPHWAERYTAPGTWFFCGFNLYADGVLLQTYHSKPAAIYVRDALVTAAQSGQELAVV